jgi:hypothetical protein
MSNNLNKDNIDDIIIDKVNYQYNYITCDLYNFNTQTVIGYYDWDDVNNEMRCYFNNGKIFSFDKNIFIKKAVQEHGFFWEKYTLCNCFEVSEEDLKGIGYTAKHDLPKDLNPEGFNISCKCSKSLNDVNMGDPIRLFDSVNNEDDKIHIIIFFWKQFNNTKKVIKTYEIDITDKKDLLFGGITKNELEELRNLVRKIPTKSKPSPEQRKEMYDLRDKLHEKKGVLRLDIKCNSQQSRIQCTIHKFTKFIIEHANLVISSNETNEFRGISIPDFEGGSRVLKKKNT